MSKYPIWTREYTSQKLDEFHHHVEKWKGRTAIGEWHDIAGIPRDSLRHYSKKHGMYERYREAVLLIRKANRRRGW